jgi:hypothetical protein
LHLAVLFHLQLLNPLIPIVQAAQQLAMCSRLAVRSPVSLEQGEEAVRLLLRE